MTSMAQSQFLDSRTVDKSSPTYISQYESKRGAEDRHVRTTVQLRSITKLTPSKELSSTSFNEDKFSQTDNRRFLSPDPRGGSSSQPRKEVISVLKNELAVLRDEVGALLTEEDRKRLEERRKLRRSQQSRESAQRVRQFDSPARSPQRIDVRSEAGYQRRSTQNFTSQQIHFLAQENQNLKSELTSLQANYEAMQRDLTDKNNFLAIKIGSIQSALAQNESYMTEYKGQMQTQFELLRRAQEEAARVPTQELERITHQSNLLKMELDNVRNAFARRQAEELERLAFQNHNLHLQLQKAAVQHREQFDKALKDVNMHHTSQIDRLYKQNTRLRLQIQQGRNQYSSFTSDQSAEIEKLKRILTEEQMNSQQNIAALKAELKIVKSTGSWMELEQKEIAIMKEELQKLRKEGTHSEASKRESQHLKEELDRVQALLTNRQTEYNKLLGKHYEDVKVLKTKSSEHEYNSTYLKGELDRINKCLTEKEAQMVKVCEKSALEAKQRETVINSLKQQVNVLGFKLAEHERASTNYQYQIKTLQNRSPQTQGTVSVLRLELEGLKKSLKTKQDELAKKTEDIFVRGKQNQEAISALSRELTGTKEKLSKALNGGNDWKMEQQRLQQDIVNLKNQIEVLKENSRQSQKLADELTRSKSLYQNKLAQQTQSTKQEVDHLHIQIDHLRRQHQEAYIRIQQMNQKLNTKDQQNTIIRNQKMIFQSQLKQLDAIIVTNMSEINSLKGHMQTKNEQNTNLEGQIQRLKAQTQGLKERNKILQEEHETDSLTESHNFEKERLIKQQQSKIRNLTDNLNMMKYNYSQMQQNLKDLTDRYQKSDQKLNEKNRELFQKSEELNSSKKLFQVKINEILSQRERWRMSDRNTEQSKLIQILESQLKQQAEHYDEIISNMKREFGSRSQNSLDIRSNSDMASIDSAIRGQLEEVNTLKKELEKKNEQLYKLKDQVTTSRSEFDNLRSELQIEKLKTISERKNMQVAFGIEMQNLKNDLGSERRANESLAQKIKYLNEENKKKDSFIQTYIIGKKLQPNQKFQLDSFFEQYSVSFPKEGILNNLFAQVQQIRNLTQQIEHLKAQVALLKGI